MLEAFRVAIEIAVVQIVTTQVWAIIARVPFLILVGLRIPMVIGIPILKCMGLTLVVGISSAIVLQSALSNPASVTLVAILGGVMLTVGALQSLTETYREKQALANTFQLEKLEGLEEGSRYDVVAYLYALALYILAILVPTVGRNRVFVAAANVIAWLTEVPILGSLLYISGFILAISQFFKAVVGIPLLIAAAGAKAISDHSESNSE